MRGDVFFERAPSGASPIFWPASWVSSGTATLDYRPADHISFRAEYRHDQAQRAMYFGSDLRQDASAAFIPNRRAQNTVTIGTTAWF